MVNVTEREKQVQIERRYARKDIKENNSSKFWRKAFRKRELKEWKSNKE